MGKPKILKDAQQSPDDAVFNMDKFHGEGVMFKCKLFGSLKVEAARGDTICAEAINRLKLQAKQLNKESKVHKQRIFLNISLKGIRIIDEKTKKLEHAHVVHKISYISLDKDDRRTFAYIVSNPEGYTLFAFRTEKNAGYVTSSLKELFHVVYLKHKQEKENSSKGNKTDEKQYPEVETGVEEKEEDPYAVPAKFQLVQRTDTEPSHYSVPNSKPNLDNKDQAKDNNAEAGTGSANLLDWTDVNEELEFISKDMKRSDTKQLLAELGDLNMDSNPPQLSDKGDVFGNDPFFDSAPFSPTFDQRDRNSSSSNPDLRNASGNNPFMLTATETRPPGSNLSVNKSRSMDVGLFDSNDMFSSTQPNSKPASNPTSLSQVGDIFSSVQTNEPKVDWNASLSNPTDNGWGMSGTNKNFDAFNSSQQISQTVNESSLFSSLEPSIQLVPEKPDQAKSTDPFAVLDGGIKDIRGTLPTAVGNSVPQFPMKNKPAPTSPRDSPVMISKGPTLHPSQQYPTQQQGVSPYQQTPSNGFGQANPFSQQSMPYGVGYNQSNTVPSIPARPDIPPRVDLPAVNTNYQGMPAMQQSFGHAAPMPYGQANNTSFQSQGNNLQSVPTANPFAGLGDAFSLGSTTSTQEPLYATVDKSKKSNTNQGGTDMFAIFDSNPSTMPNNTSTSNQLDGGAFGNSNTSSRATESNKDPFGDMSSFGF